MTNHFLICSLVVSELPSTLTLSHTESPRSLTQGPPQHPSTVIMPGFLLGRVRKTSYRDAIPHHLILID